MLDKASLIIVAPELMLLAMACLIALVDLGVAPARLRRELKKLAVRGWKLDISRVTYLQSVHDI